MNKLILASGSPRRKELLNTLNIPFDVITADIDETINKDEKVIDEIERLSFQKALAVFKEHKEQIVIGSDTIVTLDNQILGKPHSKEEAFNMLNSLQGKIHEVITSVTILSKKSSETFSVVSKVEFYPMDEAEINDYIATNEPMDKAGAYAIQGLGSKYIKGIIGDYYAIMGLPIADLYHRIKKYL